VGLPTIAVKCLKNASLVASLGLVESPTTVITRLMGGNCDPPQETVRSNGVQKGLSLRFRPQGEDDYSSYHESDGVEAEGHNEGNGQEYAS